MAIGGHDLPLPRFAPMAAVRATTGDIAAMPLYAGQGVGAVREIRPAADVGAARLLGQAPGQMPRDVQT